VSRRAKLKPNYQKKQYREKVVDYEAEEAALQSPEGARELALRLLDRVAYLQGDLYECDWCGCNVRSQRDVFAGRLEGETYTREEDTARFCGEACLVAWRRAVEHSAQIGFHAQEVEFHRLRDAARNVGVE